MNIDDDIKETAGPTPVTGASTPSNGEVPSPDASLKSKEPSVKKVRFSILRDNLLLSLTLLNSDLREAS